MTFSVHLLYAIFSIIFIYLDSSIKFSLRHLLFSIFAILNNSILQEIFSHLLSQNEMKLMFGQAYLVAHFHLEYSEIVVKMWYFLVTHLSQIKRILTLFFRSVDQCCVGECFPPTASPFFLLLSLFLGTCAMLVKETGITVFGVCLVYDLLSLSHKQEKS